MAAEAILYGAAYSAYVRIARLALAEKGATYRLEPVDVFGPGGLPAEHFSRHPFGRIPAFRHGDFQLYETAAITRYVDEAFEGPPLQPATPEGRARMAQIIGTLDSYLYRPLVWDIYVERLSVPRRGGSSDEARVAAAVARVETCLAAIEDAMGPGPWLAGETPSLADFHAAPMIAYGVMAPEGVALLARRPRLARWWDVMRARSSMALTRPDGLAD